MDMGIPQGAVEVGAPANGSPAEADGSGAGFSTTVEIAGGKLTMDGQPAEITEVLKAILEAYEAQEAPDDDEAAFQSGLGNKKRPGGDLSGMAGMGE